MDYAITGKYSEIISFLAQAMINANPNKAELPYTEKGAVLAEVIRQLSPPSMRGKLDEVSVQRIITDIIEHAREAYDHDQSCGIQ
jgi:hypothetical protein